jgi:citrate lyase subunit gamma (acyl carrier protein)
MEIKKAAMAGTLKARVECAVFRSQGITRQLPWGGVIR